MSFVPCRHRWSRAGLAGATMLFAWAVSGCGSSSLKSQRADAGSGIPGSGTGGAEPIIGAVDAAGGAAGTSRDSGEGWQDGSAMATGGGSGQDGGGGLVGGRTGAGGTTTTGGRTGAGGTTTTGGRTGAGGTTGTGGRPGTGGTTGVAGTGGVSGPDGGIDGSTSLAATLFQPLAKAFCATARICCKRSGFYQMDLDDCEAKLPARLQPYPAVDQSIVTVDASHLAACVSAYEQAATSCTMSGINAACQRVWQGTRAEGQPCGGITPFGAFDCVTANDSAACYWKDSAGYPAGQGVCVALPRGKVGDECSRSCKAGEDCVVDLVGGSAPLPVMCFEEDGLYCAVSANPPVCKPIAKVGDACTYDRGACSRDDYCDWTGSSATCQTAAKLGESCADVYCAEGLSCGTGLRCAEWALASSSFCQGTPSVP